MDKLPTQQVHNQKWNLLGLNLCHFGLTVQVFQFSIYLYPGDDVHASSEMKSQDVSFKAPGAGNDTHDSCRFSSITV